MSLSMERVSFERDLLATLRTVGGSTDGTPLRPTTPHLRHSPAPPLAEVRPTALPPLPAALLTSLQSQYDTTALAVLATLTAPLEGYQEGPKRPSTAETLHGVCACLLLQSRRLPAASATGLEALLRGFYLFFSEALRREREKGVRKVFHFMNSTAASRRAAVQPRPRPTALPQRRPRTVLPALLRRHPLEYLLAEVERQPYRGDPPAATVRVAPPRPAVHRPRRAVRPPARRRKQRYTVSSSSSASSSSSSSSSISEEEDSSDSDEE